ncbi:hypothetical protein [Cyanothece sp. BG0011]|uniref:hypothetical protein n=1 Tax=Cyanothece sp. BG0011 TaxID=2082950 RepID=UPI00130019E9|nr:hypothetical protein [Cyanothece sp. BG0011]
MSGYNEQEIKEIEQILDQLLIDYQKTQEERVKLAKGEEKEEFRKFKLFALIDY